MKSPSDQWTTDNIPQEYDEDKNRREPIIKKTEGDLTIQGYEYIPKEGQELIENIKAVAPEGNESVTRKSLEKIAENLRPTQIDQTTETENN